MLLNEMEIFYYVVELHSFSQAALHLSVSKSFISKQVSKLERDLGARLLTRSTRTLSLTEAGEVFYQHCKNMVVAANKGYQNIDELQGRPSGTLKISAPPAFGQHVLVKMLSDFLQAYPAMTVNLQLDNKLVDMVKAGIDLAIRSAVLADSNLISQKIMDYHSVICATPQYYSTNGTPVRPADLMDHRCFSYRYARLNNRWEFHKNKRSEIVTVKGNFHCNHLDMIRSLVLSHQGIALLPHFMVEDEIATKQLATCLDDYNMPGPGMYFLYPELEFMPLKVKIFIDFFKKFTGTLLTK